MIDKSTSAIRMSAPAAIASAMLLLAAPASATVFTKGAGLNPVFANQPGLLPDPIVQPFSPNLVTNGSFETGDFSGWGQVGDTSFTFVTTAPAGGGPTDGDWHAAFGAIDPGGGGIVQSIATVAGQTYTLGFDIANLAAGANGFGLFWDGDFVFVDFNLPAFTYQTAISQLTATGSSTQLAFVFYNEPSYFLLDNISLTSGVIPEPATWAMMIAGFGLVGTALRRRRLTTVSA